MEEWISRGELLKTLYQDCKCMNGHFLAAVRLAPTINCWTQCSEQLPEINAEVLVTLYRPELSGYFRKIGRFLGDKWRISNRYSVSMENVVAWMPLPDAYNPEVNQNDKT